jgi:hypothetical protein
MREARIMILVMVMLAALGLAAQAGTLVDDYILPVDVTASSESSAARAGDRTINGSGLDALGQHTNTPPDNTMWHSAVTNAVRLDYDLGAVQEVTGIHVWNYNHDEGGVGFDARNRGIKNVAVQASSDGSSWTDVDDLTFSIAPNDNNGAYTGEKYTFTEPVVGRYLRLDSDSNHGSTSFGLSEIRFITPRWISNVTATASTEISAKRVAQHTVDGSGMGGFGNERVVAVITPDDTMWLSESGTMSNHWIRFDLQSTHALAAARIWNHNHTGYTIRSIDEFYLDVSPDGSNWSTLSGPETDGRFGLAQAPGASDYIDADLIDMSGVRARYVRFRVWTGHNAGTPGEVYYAGLSEVRFYEACPTQGTMIMIH